VAVEHDEAWIQRLLPSLPAEKVSLLHETEADAYRTALERVGNEFDIISIDGLFRNDCARAAPGYLARGGFIIFDNSDLHPLACRSLREAGLVQMDFSGFGPILDAAWTTSIFIRGDFRFVAQGDVQPRSVPGALGANLDADSVVGSSTVA
jgi:hypothetical protein